MHNEGRIFVQPAKSSALITDNNICYTSKHMSRVFLTLVLLLAIGTSVPAKTQAFGQSPVSQATLQCYNVAVQNYQSFIQKYLSDYRSQIQKEFDRQAAFRVRAAKSDATRTFREKELAKQKAILAKQLDTYSRAQAKALSDITNLINGASSSTTKTVSITSETLEKNLDTNQALFLWYADKKDQATIKEVWKKRRDIEWYLLQGGVNQERNILKNAFSICRTNPPT